MKKCTKCEQDQPLSLFGLRKGVPNGDGCCKPCHSARQKQYARRYNASRQYLWNANKASWAIAKTRPVDPEYLDPIKGIYKGCPAGYHVDHIVPLNGKTVCGLHVPWNLQYLTAQENASKSNHFQ